MTSKRNVLVFLVALVLAVGMAGCGGNGNGNGEGIDTAPQDPIPEGDPNAGRDAFILGTDPACSECHALADAGSDATIGPDLDELQPSFEQVLNAINTGPGAMPSFEDISPEVKNNISAYVATFAGQGGEG